MDKLKMAHEWAMKHGKSDTIGDRTNMIRYAWDYADAMQAEADKRRKAEAEQKRKEVREMLNADNTFLEKEGQHFDDVADVRKTYSSSEEWQPDWSQAPEWAVAWTYDKNAALWWSEVPEIHKNIWDGRVQEYANAPSFNYQGNWKDSLRKRPSNI